MEAPRMTPPLPSRTYVAVVLDVDESGHEALRTITLGGHRWQVTWAGPPQTVGLGLEAQAPTVREVRLAGSRVPHEVWRQGTRWFVVKRSTDLRKP